jgi:DNA modification methylase
VNPVLTFDGVQVFHGDCVEVMRSLPDASVDSVVTDPPYGLEFMGKDWDAPWKGDVRQRGDSTFDAADESAPFGRVRHGGTRAYGTDSAVVGQAFQLWCTEWATEALRVLKPGGHLLAFGGTRTWHRLAVAIEDAGFEVRDSIAWMYGSGFPKSLDVSKAIDKAAGAEREVVGYRKNINRTVKRAHAGAFNASEGGMFREDREQFADTAPATPAAQQWQGWGTALKPAFEPIVVARKPLIGTVAENVQAHGTGGLNIDGCRIGTTETLGRAKAGWGNAAVGADNYGNFNSIGVTVEGGRWPANVILDESQAAELDRQSGVTRSATGTTTSSPTALGQESGWNAHNNRPVEFDNYGDTGGASRFFYCAKAPKKERPNVDGIAHPTVKPLKLMEYLVRLVTPPGGTVLEPFAGSGATIEAAISQGFQVIAIEQEWDYIRLIEARLNKPIQEAM